LEKLSRPVPAPAPPQPLSATRAIKPKPDFVMFFIVVTFPLDRSMGEHHEEFMMNPKNKEFLVE
jgi:hypothetical protein